MCARCGDARSSTCCLAFAANQVRPNRYQQLRDRGFSRAGVNRSGIDVTTHRRRSPSSIWRQQRDNSREAIGIELQPAGLRKEVSFADVQSDPAATNLVRPTIPPDTRSEEHTSELQSLMRT